MLDITTTGMLGHFNPLPLSKTQKLMKTGNTISYTDEGKLLNISSTPDMLLM
jgi:hypothetical protein